MSPVYTRGGGVGALYNHSVAPRQPFVCSHLTKPGAEAALGSTRSPLCGLQIKARHIWIPWLNFSLENPSPLGWSFQAVSKPLRCSRFSHVFASLSLMNSSLTGSHVSGRPNRIEMLPRWHVDTVRCELTTSDTGVLRDWTQSKKFPM